MIGGIVPLVVGIIFLILAFRDIEWIMKNKSSLLVKILGREGVRGWLALAGLFFMGGGIFLLVVGE
jgi:hypothetical protein